MIDMLRSIVKVHIKRWCTIDWRYCRKDLESARVSRLTFCQRTVHQRLVYFNYGSQSVDHWWRLRTWYNWILEVLTSGLAPCELKVQLSCARKLTLAGVFLSSFHQLVRWVVGGNLFLYLSTAYYCDFYSQQLHNSHLAHVWCTPTCPTGTPPKLPSRLLQRVYWRSR